MIKQKELRCSGFATCGECMQHKASCGGTNACADVKVPLKRPYVGVRLTSDGFDCALPVSFDSHSVCSFGCLYCFAPNLVQNRGKTKNPIGQTSLNLIEGILSGRKGKIYDLYRKALKYDKKVNGYPCPIQLGALTDPMDNIERNQGWFLKFVELCKKYNQPVRISTKGNLFLEDEYINAVADRPELFWVMFSITTIDDDILKLIDRRAPPASERIECMRRLNAVGVKTGLRFRPIIPGISDSTKKHPEAWKELINKCADAGAKNISYEVAFLPLKSMTPKIRERWKEIERIAGKPLIDIYGKFGKKQACSRASYKWTEEIMHAIHKEAKKRGMHIGVSDPAWKQLTECGCCCGIPEDDPVFGNWQRESATNRLMEARDGKIKELSSKDIIPEWAKDTSINFIINPGVGPLVKYKRKHKTWAENLKELWNDLEKERNPLHYFQGALVPTRVDKDGEVYFEYKGLKREHKKSKDWNIKDD